MLAGFIICIFLYACGSGNNSIEDKNFPTSAEEAKRAFSNAPEELLSYFDNQISSSVPYIDPNQINSDLNVEFGTSQFDRHVTIYNVATKIMEWSEVLNGVELYYGKLYNHDGSFDYVIYGNGHGAGDIWGEKHLFINGNEVLLPDIGFYQPETNSYLKNIYLIDDIRRFDESWLIIKLDSGEYDGRYMLQYAQDRVAHWFLYNVKNKTWLDFGVYGKVR